MKASLKFSLSIIISLLAFGLSSFAIEINSGNISSAPFDCEISATYCYIQNKGITSIASGTFVNHGNLQTLDFYGNPITSIESGDFNGLTNLQNLHLWNNGITSINNLNFDGLPNLQTLSLGNNQITPINSGDFNGLTNLHTLYLNSNGITSIDNLNFDGLPNLQTLHLGNNQITSIESGYFNGLPNLHTLYLNSNGITSIDNLNFNGLPNLQTLHLGNNQITSINSGDFNDLSNLQTLYLVSNGITSIDNLNFNGLPNLSSLYLGYNKITSITSGDFNGLVNLTYLNLEAIKLTSIESGDFNGLPNLQNLYLYYNCLNTENPIVTNYLDSLAIAVDYSTQLVCPFIDYTPSYYTNGSVTGSLAFIGPTSLVDQLIVDNDLSSYDHIFTENGTYGYEYWSLIDNNFVLWESVVGNGNLIITGAVTWIDTVAPTITLNGNSTFSGYVGDSYMDAGATWSDAVAGTGTLIGSGTVNTTLSGTYIITYTVADNAGNTTTATRSVILSDRPITPISTPSGGGGGGGGLLAKDNCPDGDYSLSYYDKICGIKPNITTGTIITTETISKPIDNNTTDTSTTEAEKAYERASSVGITTTKNLQQARLDSKITRAELAKMLSIYAQDVLGQKISDMVCEFEDNNQANKNLIVYIKQACQLKIMGIQSDGQTPLTRFNPNSFVTRAELGTALSRTLYGNTYNNNTTQWRKEHLEKLQQEDIINIINPTLQERRGWVMLMLYRTIQ